MLFVAQQQTEEAVLLQLSRSNIVFIKIIFDRYQRNVNAYLYVEWNEESSRRRTNIVQIYVHCMCMQCASAQCMQLIGAKAPKELFMQYSKLFTADVFIFL